MNRKSEKIIRLQYRVKELENLLCPGDLHDYVAVGHRTYEDGARVEKQVCQRCFKTREVEVY